MQIADGIYFTKDRYSSKYLLCMGGEVVGEVATRAEATKWWKRETLSAERYARGVSRAVRGRHYDRIQLGN